MTLPRSMFEEHKSGKQGGQGREREKDESYEYECLVLDLQALSGSADLCEAGNARTEVQNGGPYLLKDITPPMSIHCHHISGSD